MNTAPSHSASSGAAHDAVRTGAVPFLIMTASGVGVTDTQAAVALINSRTECRSSARPRGRQFRAWCAEGADALCADLLASVLLPETSRPRSALGWAGPWLFLWGVK